MGRTYQRRRTYGAKRKYSYRKRTRTRRSRASVASAKRSRYVVRRRTARRRTFNVARLSIPRGPVEHYKLVKLRYAAHFNLNCGATNNYWSKVQFRADDLYDPDVATGGHQPQGRDLMFTQYDKCVVVGSSCKMAAVPIRNTMAVNTSGTVNTTWPSAMWGLCMRPENADDLSRGWGDVVLRAGIPLKPHGIWENGDDKIINMSYTRAKLPITHTNNTRLPQLTARYSARKYWGLAKDTKLHTVDGLVDTDAGVHTLYEESDDLSKYKYNPTYILWTASTDQDTGDIKFTCMMEYVCLFFGRIAPTED